MSPLDEPIRDLFAAGISAHNRAQAETQNILARVLIALGEQPDVPGRSLIWSAEEVQRHCAIGAAALDTCRRPPPRPVPEAELVADAMTRAVRAVRSAHEMSCGRSQ